MAEGTDLRDIESIENADGTEVVLPGFSVVIPTWKDPEGLRRTLVNLITQSCDMLEMPVPRDFHIVGDGYEEEVAKVCEGIIKAIEPMPHVRLGYHYLMEHSGGGNFPRACGLKMAQRDWVVFIDTGTAVSKDFFHTMAMAVMQNPEAKFITWDMLQLLDPVPILTVSKAIFDVDRSQGLPYIFPGCATAVRRDIAQLIPWPNIIASDWVYFSQLWDKIYLSETLDADGNRIHLDTPEAIEKDVVVIPWTLTCAYGNRTERKWREPADEDGVRKLGWTMGFNQARAALALEKANGLQSGTEDKLPAVPEATHP